MPCPITLHQINQVSQLVYSLTVLSESVSLKQSDKASCYSTVSKPKAEEERSNWDSSTATSVRERIAEDRIAAKIAAEVL